MAAKEGVEKSGISLDENTTKEDVNFQNIRVKRPVCERCRRPKKVCLCEAIPDKPLEISTTVYILQHPEERHRTLATVPLLSACLPEDKCIVYNDVRYSQEKYPALHKLLKSPQTLVLYPDANAIDLREVVKESRCSENYNLVVPDGTWRQARQIFKRNAALQQARKVQLNENMKSHYIIRTQPTRNSLSTLEAISVALSILEGKDEITEVLRKPLELLCDIQLQHGAVPHSSKEEKKEMELLQQEKTKEEINLKGQTGWPEKEQESKPATRDERPGRETQHPERNENNDNSRQAHPQKQMEEGLSQSQYVEKQEILNQNLGQNQIKEHELEIEHVPKRTKLDDEKL